MAWTTPRTWIAGELVSAAIMNQHVRDNLALLAPAYAYPTGTYDAQNQLANSAWQPFILGSSTNTYTRSGINITDSDTTLTPTVAGLYWCRAQVQVGSAGYEIRLLRNGTSFAGGSGAAGAAVSAAGFHTFNGSTDKLGWQGFGRSAISQNWPLARVEMFKVAG